MAGSPPKAEQRIYFANHQSHLDWVLIWAALPSELRASTRPIAARDYWTPSPFKQWLTTAVFNAVYVSRTRTATPGGEGGAAGDEGDPLEPLVAALEGGDSLVISPRARAAAAASRSRSRAACSTWRRSSRTCSWCRPGSTTCSA